MRDDTRKRVNRLNRRVRREALVFPKKDDKVLQRLVKKANHKRPKTYVEQMREWKEFMEKMK